MKVSYLCMTGYDGPAPGIEIWPASPEFCDSAVAQRSMQRYLDMAVAARGTVDTALISNVVGVELGNGHAAIVGAPGTGELFGRPLSAAGQAD